MHGEVRRPCAPACALQSLLYNIVNGVYNNIQTEVHRSGQGTDTTDRDDVRLQIADRWGV